MADLFTVPDPKPGHAGMARALNHADPLDVAAVRAIVVFHVEILREAFTCDAITAELPDWRRDRLAAFPGALGGLFFQMQREGLIERVGYQPSTRREARGRPIAIWRGTR